MAIYNYKQFEDAARAAGLYEQFSAADLSLAQKNPDAGMSLLKYKQDYAAATTDAARALANQGAEEIRSSYGGYTGGGDGGSFHLEPLSPSSFTYDAAPTYTNRYDEEANKLMQEILNREEFNYNPETDPLYSSYKKQYTREGQRATQDAIGAAAGATGGIPSSYAVTAASQAGDYYAAQMADKVPELYELAYNKYLNEYNMKLSDLDVVRGAEESDYAKYLDQLGQYNTDRNFAYGQHLDEIDSQTAERAEALEKALLAAQYGDYSFLEKMGVTPDLEAADFERQYALAELAAAYGDTSYLEALGIKPKVDTTESGYTLDEMLKLAQLGVDHGDSSILLELGITPGLDEQEKTNKEIQNLLNTYSNGVMPADKWEEAAATYGEDVLRAAGLSKATEANTIDTNYAYETMKRNNVSKALQDGMMTQEKWETGKREGDEAANLYDTYEEYVNAYVAYAIQESRS